MLAELQSPERTGARPTTGASLRRFYTLEQSFAIRLNSVPGSWSRPGSDEFNLEVQLDGSLHEPRRVAVCRDHSEIEITNRVIGQAEPGTI